MFKKNEPKEDLLEDIKMALVALRTSTSYRPGAIPHKIKVLEAAQKYLTGQITKITLEQTIKSNKRYTEATGKSKTKELIDRVINLKTEELAQFRSSHRTSDGYYRIVQKKG